MKKFFCCVFVLFFCTGIFAKENLAILPFSGGQGDEGETIAELFSFNDRLNAIFSPIPRTSITQAINREQNFQIGSGMTDADTIVAIGKQLGARYVVAGNITSVGKNKLLVIAIMDIKNLQQIAGDYQSYNNIAEIRRKLPNMASTIIQATQKNTSKLPKLAVPVQLFGDVDQSVADTLTQILAINLIKSGKYSVYPRTKSLEQVMEEHKTQISGITADSNIVGIGYGENPNLVLSVVARKPDGIKMFNAVIINLSTGEQVVGRSVDYKDINDGVNVMETLSVLLTSTSAEIDKKQKAEERKASWKKFWNRKFRESRRNYYEFASGYFQWGDELMGVGGSGLTSVHWTPIPFFSLGVETRFCYPLYDGGRFSVSGSPTLGLTLPITGKFKIFGDATLELGYFGEMKGTFTDWMTPAYDCGILFDWKSRFFTGLEIKYRGTWYEGAYVHSIGMGFLLFGFKN